MRQRNLSESERKKKFKHMHFDKELIEKLKYFIMRLQFIHPIYLPPLSESFLRKDFNFAQYLAYAYGKTLKNFFNLSWVALLLILVLIDSLRIAYFATTDPNEEILVMPIIVLTVPVIFLLSFLSFFFYFRKIERVLYP